jgi:hypothetical protein
MNRIIPFFGLMLLLVACKPDPPENPYIDDALVVGIIDGESPVVEGSFTWLHEQVFQPTCANSGCHDGTFEPNFTTVGSAYNTLVNHPVIANDAAAGYAFRVVPGDPSSSWLMERLMANVPNTSGMMPLSVEPGSDWPANRPSYLAAISEWIESGAPDLNGNLPQSANLSPQVSGFGGFPAGNLQDPYQRDPEANYRLEVEAGMIDLWFAISDDSTALADLDVQLRVSESLADLDAAIPVSVASPFTFEAVDFAGSMSTYGHRATIDLSGAAAESTHYLRLTIEDGTNSIEVPAAGAQPYFFPLYSLYVP